MNRFPSDMKVILEDRQFVGGSRVWSGLVERIVKGEDGNLRGQFFQQSIA